MKWEVRPHREVTAWLNGLDVQSRHQVAAAIDMITDQGPALREPLVKPIRGSRHHNMKELRPGSVGRTEIRILFIFDPQRRAVLLVAGDKSGNWKGWYDKNIPIADDRYDEHLAKLDD